MADSVMGRCLCGQTRFSFTGDVNWVVNCHCETCRRATSSPMTTWVSVPNEAFCWEEGEPAHYSSSPGVVRHFCDQCGTPLSYIGERMPGEIHLYLASLDNPEQFAPTAHVFESERLNWFEVHDELPRFETTRKGGAAEPTHYGPRR